MTREPVDIYCLARFQESGVVEYPFYCHENVCTDSVVFLLNSLLLSQSGTILRERQSMGQPRTYHTVVAMHLRLRFPCNKAF